MHETAISRNEGQTLFSFFQVDVQRMLCGVSKYNALSQSMFPNQLASKAGARKYCNLQCQDGLPKFIMAHNSAVSIELENTFFSRMRIPCCAETLGKIVFHHTLTTTKQLELWDWNG